MKKLILGIMALAMLAIFACNDGTSSEDNYFSMRVNGTYLEADTSATFYFIWEADSGLGIYAAGGTVSLCHIVLYGVGGTGTYPILANGFSEAGLRFDQLPDVYYIDETHGTGSLTLEEYDYTPGTIHRLKGTFEGTAETDGGASVTITEGKFSYTEP
jgi:hypothetical protein